jgi:hypothetical protein
VGRDGVRECLRTEERAAAKGRDFARAVAVDYQNAPADDAAQAARLRLLG